MIPDFQREIRWESENVSQLIDDISSGPKYLGNVILTRHTGQKFSIIDGQQRITILTMVLSCLMSRHNSRMEVFAPCQLLIESFSEFWNLLGRGFAAEELEKPEVIKADQLQQRQKYYDLWQYISAQPVIADQIKAESFLENLGKSTVNIILNKSSDISDGIRYFIDVNLKGKQLDTEDIFKSYLFKNDSRKEIRDEWYRFKENVTKAAQLKMNYPLLKFLEHYFYCDLYKDPKYQGLEFGENFLLKKEFKTKEAHPQTFREGTHIIELIRDRSYMLQSLRNLNAAIAVMIEIISSSSITSDFSAHFSCCKNGKPVKIDPNELKIFHNIMGKVLKDSAVLPKALIMKYILSTMLREDSGKKEFQRVYGVYLFAVLFIIFENKKSIDVLLSVLKADDENWYSELINQIKSYFSPDRITDAKLMAQYKLAANQDEEDYRFRCKSLATIYNFFKIKGDSVAVDKKDLKPLYQFITDSDKFSVEHFIISDSEHRTTLFVIDGKEETYTYERQFYGKYINSLFNFIFIPEKLNSELKNNSLPLKLGEIDPSRICCSYSLMYLKNVQSLGDSIQKAADDAKRYKDNLDLYFSRDFRSEYVQFARAMLNEVIEKIKP